MKSFDFIVVGGGTSGTVTAEKLVKNGYSVLIIEEGKKKKTKDTLIKYGVWNETIEKFCREETKEYLEKSKIDPKYAGK